MAKLRQRGIALFLLIVITSLLLILLGAFFQVNRDQLTLAGYSSQSEKANRACASATEYCFFRLEHNKFWARAAFDDDYTDGSVAPELEVREIGGSHRVEGKLTDLDAEFRVVVTNNLSGSSESGGVPVSACRLRITGTCGGVTQQREVLLRIAPLFDGAAVSSGGINIEATGLKLTSEHPLRNQIRSKGDIHVPSANRLDFVPAVAQADKGVIWSQQDVTVGGQSVTNQSVMANAVSQTGGRFIPDAKTSYDIHDLKISEVGVDANTSVRSGLYLFSRVQVEYEVGGITQTASVKVMERRTRAIDDAGFSSGELQEFWYVSEPGGIPEGARMAGTSVVGHPRDSTFWLVDNRVKVNLTEDWMAVDEDAHLHVDGDFGVASYQNDIIPQLVFGELVGGIGDGVAEENSGSIIVDGDLGVEGPIRGAGKLLATGNVHLRPNWASVTADEQADLSIYAGKDITIKPPYNWEAGTAVDRSLTFNGLLYAKDNVEIQTRTNQPLNIRGAVVARNGMINIHDASQVTLHYDQKYVDHIVRELPEDRIHLERALWKG